MLCFLSVVDVPDTAVLFTAVSQVHSMITVVSDMQLGSTVFRVGLGCLLPPLCLLVFLVAMDIERFNAGFYEDI